MDLQRLFYFTLLHFFFVLTDTLATKERKAFLNEAAMHFSGLGMYVPIKVFMLDSVEFLFFLKICVLGEFFQFSDGQCKAVSVDCELRLSSFWNKSLEN